MGSNNTYMPEKPAYIMHGVKMRWEAILNTAVPNIADGVDT
jgi:hypothetical protein